jgi:hypothetical protein
MLGLTCSARLSSRGVTGSGEELHEPVARLSHERLRGTRGGYATLQRVKAWDPGDVFNHRQSVELPDGD